jgi:hypothetical protein
LELGPITCPFLFVDIEFGQGVIVVSARTSSMIASMHLTHPNDELFTNMILFIPFFSKDNDVLVDLILQYSSIDFML